MVRWLAFYRWRKQRFGITAEPWPPSRCNWAFRSSSCHADSLPLQCLRASEDLCLSSHSILDVVVHDYLVRYRLSQVLY